MSRIVINKRELKDFTKCVENLCKVKKKNDRVAEILHSTGFCARYLGMVRKAIWMCETIVDDPLKYSKAERDAANMFLGFYDMTSAGKEDEEIIKSLNLGKPEESN